ncbi:hypothetical protein [Streptomyces abikoensis]|uniref:4Fe-4S Wbl-type domain-containing protein n=1 Tax=Streptomyces abikoensis TaxID=97398 RepID=A0ABW7T4L4_9ACTN
MITSTTSAAWTAVAPCAGVDAFVLPAQKPLDKDLIKQAGLLMESCTRCPFIAECFTRVRPVEGFDGVCAARLWINGRAVATADSAPPLSALPSLAGVCGERSGRRKHQELGEPLCGACRASGQRAESRRAGRANIRNLSGPSTSLAAAC